MSPRETVKRSFNDLVAQVVDGGKKRKVTRSLEPEKEVAKGVLFMVKIGCMRCDNRIGRVEVAVRKAGVKLYEGTKWLV